jgi:hypothetical protein
VRARRRPRSRSKSGRPSWSKQTSSPSSSRSPGPPDRLRSGHGFGRTGRNSDVAESLSDHRRAIRRRLCPRLGPRPSRKRGTDPDARRGPFLATTRRSLTGPAAASKPLAPPPTPVARGSPCGPWISRQPAAGDTVKRFRLSLADHKANPERIVEIDRGKLGGSGADQREVARVQGAAEVRVRRALDRHERMFAS